ncbi:MAG: Serine/threonine-protein kinase PknD [Actinomycetia bacterium]|nr:Serine/threonine-protein kinase PknD [Actinomycetes bacterium]
MELLRLDPDSAHRSRTLRALAVLVVIAVLAAMTFALRPRNAHAATAPGDLSIYAGTGVDGTPTAGPATASPMNPPSGVATDAAGNVYIASPQNSAVAVVDPAGNLSNIPAFYASPTAVAVDGAGNVFVADAGINQVSKWDGTTQTPVAGDGTTGSIVPGPAAASPLPSVQGVAVDGAGNVFLSFTGAPVIAKVDTSGDIAVYAGDGTTGTPVAGAATSSPLAGVYNLSADAAGNIYLPDLGNHVIEKVDPSGTLSVVAGTGSFGNPFSGNPATGEAIGNPYATAVDDLGNLYIADQGNNELFKVSSGTITTIAGTGNNGVPVPGPALSSPMDSPQGVAVDGRGNVYLSDTNNRVVEQIGQSVAPRAVTIGTASVNGTDVTIPWTVAATGGLPDSYTVTATVNGVAGAPVAGITATTYTVHNATAGATYSFVVTAVNGAGSSSPSSASNTVQVADAPTPPTTTAPPNTPPAPSQGPGYWLLGADGGIFSFGTNFYGSTGAMKLDKPVVGMTSTADGKGYWFVARDGGIFSFGDATFKGSVPQSAPVDNIVGMAADTATGGYWIVGSDGGVYAYGAPYKGSVPGLGVNVHNIVGIAATPSGNGYYLVGSDGGVYAFGDAVFQGSMGGTRLNGPVVGMAVDSATGGYWLTGADGGVFSFNAPFRGSTGALKLDKPVVGMTATADGSGYWFVASDGGIFAFNAPFRGSMGGTHLNAPVVGMAVAGS